MPEEVRSEADNELLTTHLEQLQILLFTDTGGPSWEKQR